MRLTLVRLIAGASAAGALIAGLNAGSAKAVLSCTFGDTAGCNGTDNGVTFSDFSYGFNGDGGADANDTITITYDSGSKSHTIVYNFAATGTNLTPSDPQNTPYSQAFFLFKATASGKTFKSAQLDFVSTNLATYPNSFVDTTYFGDADQNITLLSLSSDGSTGNFGPGLTEFFPIAQASVNYAGYQDYLNAGSVSASVSSVTQTLTYENTGPAAVPGPLPVLGAATAFGFSRRLRRRIQKRA